MGPLRAEIEPIVAADGWTKAAMGKMWKLDSLLKESQRVHGIGLSASTFLSCLPVRPRAAPRFSRLFFFPLPIPHARPQCP